MSNYVKLTDFASKDALPSGSPAKIVKGTELDDEFEAIETAIASKYNTADTDALILTAKQSLYPVGSVYINASVSTNPATLLGFGTWSEIGAGRVLVGQDAADTLFDTLGETGGSKDAVNVSHTHTATVTDPGHSHNYKVFQGENPDAGTHVRANDQIGRLGTTESATTGITVSNSTEGEDGTNKNIQPYIVVKMWQRTA